MPDGGRSAAWGLRYQYLRTLEALMDAVEDPACGVVAVHIEGVPSGDGVAVEGIDFELTDAGGHTVLAAQVKARAAGTELGAGQVFRALGELVRDRDAASYKLIVGALAGKSAKALAAILRSGLGPLEAKEAISKILASVSAERQLALLSSLEDEHLGRLGRADVEFDGRDHEEIIERLRGRLRHYRNQASAGLGEQSAGLMIGYLVSEVFRRAARAADATMSVDRFRDLVLADGAIVASALGVRDWGVVVGPVPAMPEVRRAGPLAKVQDALPLKAVGIAVPNCRITGLSGIGKTSLAAGYVFERADIYDVIFWADGESEVTLASSYSRIHLEVHGRDAPVPADSAVLRDAVLRGLSGTAGRWLLVIDNCTDLRGVDIWIPRAGHGHVIVTTTDSASPPWASTQVPVTGMAVAQAVDLLSQGLGILMPPDEAQSRLLEQLSEELECWPLALKLACAYLRGGYGIDDIPGYLSTMKIASLRDPDLVPPRYPRPLVQAIELCVQRIQGRLASPDPAAAWAAQTALEALQVSGYMASRQIPVYLAASAVEVKPGEDAFRGYGPVVADHPGRPPVSAVRVLRWQSLVETDEHLPLDGLGGEDSRRLSFTLQVNRVIQEVIQDQCDGHESTGVIIDHLAWHAERWLRLAIDAEAHECALILASHAAAIEAHADRLGRQSDFVALLRGQLAILMGLQNRMEEAARLLRAEISHFRGREDERALFLTCQASVALAGVLATVLVEDGPVAAADPARVSEITRLLKAAYLFVRDDLSMINAKSAAGLAARIHAQLRGLELNDVRHKDLARLGANVKDLAKRLPATEYSQAWRTLQDVIDRMDDHRDVPGAATLAKDLLDSLDAADASEGLQLRRQARKMLIEALVAQDDIDTALAELDLFIADAQPASLYVKDIEYLIHNTGLGCGLGSLMKVPQASTFLARLLADGRAGLVEHAFTSGDGAARVRLLTGVDALRTGDLPLARSRASEFLDRHAPRETEQRWRAGGRKIASLLSDAVTIQEDRAKGFPGTALRVHEHSGLARVMTLPPHLRQWLTHSPLDILALCAALIAMTTEFTPSLGTRPVPACHILQGALKHLGVRSQVIAASALVLHDADGTLEHIGECQRAPALRHDGTSDCHAVVWVESSRRLIDPTISRIQHLHVADEDNPVFAAPVMMPLMAPGLLFSPSAGVVIGCRRPPLTFSWDSQPRWTQPITPAPGSTLGAALSYGKLALAHATLDLIRGTRPLRSDLGTAGETLPRPLAALLDDRTHLPTIPAEPPAAFLRVLGLP